MAVLNVTSFITEYLSDSLLIGFGSGFILCATIYVVRAAVRLFVKTIKS